MDTHASGLIKENNERIVKLFGPVGFVFNDNPEHGDCAVGPEMALTDSAGSYVGSQCFEYMDDDERYFGEWVGPLPFCRSTPYMRPDQAQAHAALVTEHQY